MRKGFSDSTDPTSVAEWLTNFGCFRKGLTRSAHKGPGHSIGITSLQFSDLSAKANVTTSVPLSDCCLVNAVESLEHPYETQKKEINDQNKTFSRRIG